MTHWPEHIRGTTAHSRLGTVSHGFRYGVDYVLIDPETRDAPTLFSRNRFNLLAVHDRDHGGAPKAGTGVSWARGVLSAHGLNSPTQVMLLTQPAFLGYIFNPVSFWLAFDGDDLRAVIAEVNNTFGDRHSYLCHLPGFAPLGAQDMMTSRKVFHVSPFQQVAGDYEFAFSIQPDRIAIRIVHRHGDEALLATLTGPRKPLKNRAIVAMMLRRPLGALRTIGLIYWQAVRLKLKGAPYRTRPVPPTEEVT